jgi:uncharacterized membrane protein
MRTGLTGLAERWESVRSSYWFVPGLMAMGAGALALGMVALDGRVGAEAVERLGWIYAGGPEGARGVLSTIAGSMITVAGVTFSVLVVALSLASSQFGPRVLGSFMRDTGNQVVLGAFTGTFLYCLLVLRTVRGGEDAGTFVPHLSVTVAVAMAVLGVAVLIYFVHHAAVSIQVSSVVASLAQDLDASIDRLFPGEAGPGDDSADAHGPPATDWLPLRSRHEGYLQAIDVQALLGVAQEHGLHVRVEVPVGAFVARGDVLATVHPGRGDDAGGEHGDALRGPFVVGHRRTPSQDVEFSVQQIVDVAVRALSPGINDPFTAGVCLDRLGAALARVAERPDPACVHRDAEAAARVWFRPPRFGGLAETAFGPLRDYAGGSATVLVHMLSTLHRVAGHVRDGSRAQVVRSQAALVLALADRTLQDAAGRAAVQARHAEVESALSRGSRTEG